MKTSQFKKEMSNYPEYATYYENKYSNNGPYYASRYCSYSDYSGSLIEAVNVQVISELFSRCRWVKIHYGYCGHTEVRVYVDKLPKRSEKMSEFIDIMEQLDTYPLLDEDLYSEMMREQENIAWDDWVKDDFLRATKKRCKFLKQEYINGSDDINSYRGIGMEFNVWKIVKKLDDNELYELFRKIMEHSNIYFENEISVDMWINVDHVVDHMFERLDIFDDWINELD